MGFLKKVQDAIWETLAEFQAGPDRPSRPRKKKKRPKWMDMRKRLLKKEPDPVKQEPVKQVQKKTRVWQRLKQEYQEPMEIKREPAVFKQEPQEWEKDAAKDSGLNAKIEEPQERVERVLTEPVKKKLKKNRQFYENTFSKKRKHLLFMNPGSKKIKEAMDALANNTELPSWAQPFRENLHMEKGRLMFDDLRMATHEEKREAVKRQYFDPKCPSTIMPIADVLREKYANVSKGNVTRILRTLETYQRNFGRRRPPKVMGRMSLKNIIAEDRRVGGEVELPDLHGLLVEVHPRLRLRQQEVCHGREGHDDVPPGVRRLRLYAATDSVRPRYGPRAGQEGHGEVPDEE